MSNRDAEVQWITSDGLKLRFVAWGPRDAPAIVMLHGLRSYAYTWEPVAAPLLPNWKVIALDQRGRGHSDWDAQRNYFTDAYVRDLEALVDRLALKRFVLVGHSMGGANALVYASRHPDRLSALVVEDMGPGASAGGRGADRIKRELRETPSSFTSWEEATAFWRKIRPDVSATALQSRATHSLKEEKSGHIVWRYDAEGIAEARLSARPEQVVDLWPHVEALNIPTLLMRGANSDFLTADIAREMCRRNPRILWRDIPSSTHYVHDDNLPEFNFILQQFLEEIRPQIRS